jgi:hypothetical protein
MRIYDHAWRKVRARVLDGAQLCHICGGALDWDAPPRSPFSPTVDHRLPVSFTRGLDDETRHDLALDPSLLQPAHYSCNSRKGNRRRHYPQHVSRKWV